MNHGYCSSKRKLNYSVLKPVRPFFESVTTSLSRRWGAVGKLTLKEAHLLSLSCSWIESLRDPQCTPGTQGWFVVPEFPCYVFNVVDLPSSESIFFSSLQNLEEVRDLVSQETLQRKQWIRELDEALHKAEVARTELVSQGC